MSVKLAVIGVGNRTGKYLHYFSLHPDAVELVAVVEPDPIRREACRKRLSRTTPTPTCSWWKTSSRPWPLPTGSPPSPWPIRWRAIGSVSSPDDPEKGCGHCLFPFESDQ